MGCNCGNKNRAGASAMTKGVPGTYRVMANGRKVYESTNGKAAESVGERFDSAEINTPSGTTLTFVAGRWIER